MHDKTRYLINRKFQKEVHKNTTMGYRIGKGIIKNLSKATLVENASFQKFQLVLVHVCFLNNIFLKIIMYFLFK